VQPWPIGPAPEIAGSYLVSAQSYDLIVCHNGTLPEGARTALVVTVKLQPKPKLVILPQSDKVAPSPKNQTASTAVEVKCTPGGQEDATPLPCRWELHLEKSTLQANDGHVGHAPNRPLGGLLTGANVPAPEDSFSCAQDGSIDRLCRANGFANPPESSTVTFVAPPAAGSVVLKGNCPSGECEPQEHEFLVANPLEPIGGSGLVTMVGTTATHPVNSYVSGAMKARLLALSTSIDSARRLGTFPRELVLTELSLPLGGLFDLSGQWSEAQGHKAHRIGNDADVRVCDLSDRNFPSPAGPAYRKLLEKLICSQPGLGFPVPAESPAVQIDNLCATSGSKHWHVSLNGGRCWRPTPANAISQASSTASCPSPSGGLAVNITPQVSFESATSLYRYQYILTNEPTSASDIDSYVLTVPGDVEAVEAPVGWSATTTRSRIHWFASSTDPTWVDDGYGVPPSPDQIPPGSSLQGFAFKSLSPPRSAEFLVGGFVPRPAPVAEEDAEDRADGCPAALPGVYGQTEGPSHTLRLNTLSPCRILDTRLDLAGALIANQDRIVALSGTCGVPASARAVSLNVTVTQPSDPGNLRIWPPDVPLPPSSTLNYAPGQTRANNSIVAIDDFGFLSVRAQQQGGTAHIILDVNGYFE
jgi:hypothetical protein